MIRVILISLISIIFLTSCVNDKKDKLRVVTSNWIGYTPLFYAREKGLLDKLNIQLLSVVSLSESLHTYKSKHADIFLGTQYEYEEAFKRDNQVVPIMLLNKSDGGDVVMSNLTLEEIKKEDKQIDVFLELSSVNSLVFDDFITKHNIKNKNFNYVNKDQSFIAQQKEFKNPTIVISYNPYNITLEKNGLKTLETTKDNIEILIVDAMFTTNDILIKYKDELKELKKIIDIAIDDLEKDEKAYYDLIKDYLYDTSFEEFQQSLSNIKWINKNIDQNIIDSLKEHSFPTKELL
ncbi:ABC transporter substrate-binding protein [Aliarcobacter cryaerophilus]|uniref:ABC transporter substrate-binding protein n=1 Tax=Aliarcobacter cryaerophilus TaxID=28198 RepID=UPI003DA3AD30